MITVAIFSVLLVQSSASFFGQFTGALSSVTSSVGKLFSDVGHDLKETYDCTVDAVEEVIYDKNQISKYYDKCKTTTSAENKSASSEKDAPQTISVYISPIIPVNTNENHQKETTTKPVNLITENKDIDKKLASVEQVVNNEFYRVDNMSSHLEHEFDGLAKNVDMELKKIEEDKIDLHKTLREMEKLHLQEEIDIEKTKDEIRQAFDEILKKINNSSNESHLANEIESIVGDVEKKSSKTILEEIEKWKEKEMEQLKELKDAKKDEITSTESNIPRTFKDLAAKVSKDTSTSNPNNIANDNSTILQASSTDVTQSSSETITQPSTTTIASSSEPVTPVSTASTVASTITSKKPINLASTPTVTEPLPQVTTTITTNKSITKVVTPVPTTETSTVTTIEPVSQILTTTTISPTTGYPTTAIPSTEPVSTTRSTTIKHKKHTKKPNSNKHKLTTAKHHRTKSTTPKPPDDYDGLVPKDPRAAAAEALKIFGKSIKTKSILDNFLKHLKVANLNTL